VNDKSLGIIIATLGIGGMISYFIWAFGPSLPGVNEVVTPEISEWAYKLPVLLAVYVALVIIVWIGYTMATTPPPLPLENPLDIDRTVGDTKE